MAGGSVTFQAQNPAKSGDTKTYIDAFGRRRLAGWTNCTAFVAAMGAQFDSGVRITGTQVRKESNEPVPDSDSPGLNLNQVQAVLRAHGVRMGIETPIDFADLDDLRLEGHAIALQLGYGPIHATEFSGDRAFKGGHIALWLPSGEVFDPLNDGRRPSIAKAPVRIPKSILREAAGSLVLNPTTGRTVGVGKAYAGIFSARHPVGAEPQRVMRVEFTFGGGAGGQGEYEITVPMAFVRSSPRGVPGRANVVGRRAQGARVRVLGTTRRGQRVGGSRGWHQVDREGTRFMHSSVIDPVDLHAIRMSVKGGRRALDQEDGPPVVDDPDATGADLADGGEPDIPSPATDVPGEDEPDAP